MKRIEIIGNRELMADLEESLWVKVPHIHYTILDVLAGKGRKGQARGDGVWPTINFCCVLFVENEEDIKTIQNIVKIVKHDNTVNAFKAFISEGDVSRLPEYKPRAPVTPEPAVQADTEAQESELTAENAAEGVATNDGALKE